MKILRFFAFITLMVTQTTSFALQINSVYIQDTKLFGIEFPDGTSYYGRADKLVAVSKQRYLVGPLLVTEVNIELEDSPIQVRIYNSRTMTAEELSNLAKKKVSSATPFVPQIPAVAKKFDKETESATSQQNVCKDYPQTTHARTLEFVVPKIKELEAFYNELYAHFIKKDKKVIHKKTFILED